MSDNNEVYGIKKIECFYCEEKPQYFDKDYKEYYCDKCIKKHIKEVETCVDE